MPRPRSRLGWAVLGAACLAVGASAPATGEPDPPSSWPLATVHTDPGGDATLALERATQALARRQWPVALEMLYALVEDHPDVLLPVPVEVEPRTGLRWPAREVAEVLLTRLPEDVRAEAVRRWQPAARVLALRAQRGDAEALHQLAFAWPLTPEGGGALRVLATRALEAGRYSVAIRRLERWLRTHPGAPEASRARAVLQLGDALAQVGAVHALRSLELRFPVASETAVRLAEGSVRPLDRVRAHLEEAGGERPPLPDAGPDLPDVGVVLWTRVFDRAAVRTNATADAKRHVTVGAVGDEERLYLHEGGVVRCLETFTGRELWRFPPARPGTWIYDPLVRYPAHDVPLRSVTPADAMVLVVLGDPPGTGGFVYEGVERRFESEAQESRTRLVALDRETGAFRWSTGIPSETHPVLGDPDTGCASPPLVVGDAVFALFARRRGVSELYAARLALDTGKPSWVRFLGAGESGRSPRLDERARRLRDEFVHAIPWGARPSLAGGELCVTPHAGLAAGLDPVTGAPRWLRVLPRYDIAGHLDVEYGFSGRNVPLFHGGTWALAPADCPGLVALQHGTGRWQWGREAEVPGDLPPWRHLFGPGSPATEPLLRLDGDFPAVIEARRAEVPVHRGDAWDGLPGRPYADARGTVRLVYARVEEEDDGDVAFPPSRGPAFLSAPWSRLAGRGPEVVRHVRGGGSAFPVGGDVVRAGSVWIVVGRDAVGAFGSFADAHVWAKRIVDDAGASATQRAAALALRARLDLDLVQAVHALEAVDPEASDGAWAVVLDVVEEIL
ncbi:MAG: outer membrane protein assembly factor BamB family protein, partial [Planctomycetota bacterium]